MGCYTQHPMGLWINSSYLGVVGEISLPSTSFTLGMSSSACLPLCLSIAELCSFQASAPTLTVRGVWEPHSEVWGLFIAQLPCLGGDRWGLHLKTWIRETYTPPSSLGHTVLPTWFCKWAELLAGATTWVLWVRPLSAKIWVLVILSPSFLLPHSQIPSCQVLHIPL